MLEYLEQLRKKPLSYRKRIVVFTATAATAVIVIVWLSTLNFSPSDSIDSEKLSEDLKPFEEIKENIGNFYASVKDISKNIFGGIATSTSR